MFFKKVLLYSLQSTCSQPIVCSALVWYSFLHFLCWEKQLQVAWIKRYVTTHVLIILFYAHMESVICRGMRITVDCWCNWKHCTKIIQTKSTKNFRLLGVTVQWLHRWAVTHRGHGFDSRIRRFFSIFNFF